MSFSGTDVSQLSNLTGQQQDTNLYDPDRAYTQQLLAYEMNGPGAVTGSQYNPFNEGPASQRPNPQGWKGAPDSWQYGGGHLPNSPITPNDTLPPPTGNPNNTWNGQQWGPSGGTGGTGGGNGNPFGPGNLPTANNTPQRPLDPNLPIQHQGDPGTSTNPIRPDLRPGDPGYDPSKPQGGAPSTSPQNGAPVHTMSPFVSMT